MLAGTSVNPSFAETASMHWRSLSKARPPFFWSRFTKSNQADVIFRRSVTATITSSGLPTLFPSLMSMLTIFEWQDTSDERAAPRALDHVAGTGFGSERGPLRISRSNSTNSTCNGGKPKALRISSAGFSDSLARPFAKGLVGLGARMAC